MASRRSEIYSLPFAHRLPLLGELSPKATERALLRISCRGHLAFLPPREDKLRHERYTSLKHYLREEGFAISEVSSCKSLPPREDKLRHERYPALKRYLREEGFVISEVSSCKSLPPREDKSRHERYAVQKHYLRRGSHSTSGILL